MRVLGQVRELLQQAGAIVIALAHADDAATADVDVLGAQVFQRVEPILVIAGGDDFLVVLGRGIEVVVVIIEPGGFQFTRLLARQHAERDAGLHAEILDQADHFDDLVEVLVGRVTPGRAHAKTGGAILFRIQRRRAHFLDRQQSFAFEPGVVAGALRAIGAIFRAGAGLDTQQGADLNRVRIEIGAVRGLRLEHQVIERQLEKRFNFV